MELMFKKIHAIRPCSYCGAVGHVTPVVYKSHFSPEGRFKLGELKANLYCPKCRNGTPKFRTFWEMRQAWNDGNVSKENMDGGKNPQKAAETS